MNLFGLFKNKDNDAYKINESDQIWVEDNFNYLISVFGYPKQENKVIIFSEDYFPNTFNSNKVIIENIIKDLSSLIQIQEDKISIELVKDIRDTYAIPYEIEGNPFEIELEIKEGKYKIHIANNLQNRPNRLIQVLVYEFIKIKHIENKAQFDKNDDTDLFLYLAGVYFGFGILLTQNLSDSGRSNDGQWETNWNYNSNIPDEIISFALALYSKLINLDTTKWKDYLSNKLNSQLKKAIKYLDENPSFLFDQNELESIELLNRSDEEYLKNKFEEAIASLQKILFLTKDDNLKADVYNNLGYYNIRLKNYVEAVNYFKSSIEIIPDFGYANDNLGYTLIQLGKLEEAKHYLEKALETKNNDIAYTNRNLALYYQAKGEMDKASEFFKKSFESLTEPVDLLEYHYSDFLIQNGETEKGLEFLNKAIEKGEPEASEKMEILKKTINK